MSIKLKLCISFVVLLTWNKAGLATGYGTYLLYILGLVILFMLIFDKSTWNKKNTFFLFPMVTLLTFIIVGSSNPRYKIISNKEIFDVGFEETLMKIKNQNKIDYISNSIKIIVGNDLKKPLENISLFFYFKNSYIYKFNPDEDDLGLKFFNSCENLMNVLYNKYIPSVTIKDSLYFNNVFYLIMTFFIALYIYNLIYKRSQIKAILWILVLNCFLLTLVGFYQKFIHEWNDQYIEILGIWNAPEPRYYFSTFTYKNHWSAYVLMCISGAFLLFKYELNNSRFLYFFNKKIIFILLLILIISFSILLSGSRTGIILLFISLLIHTFLITKKYLKNISSQYYFFLVLLSLPSLIFLFTTLKNDKKWIETVSVSSAQWNNLLNGNPPLRWYFWNDTLKMIRGKTFLGYGFNNFVAEYPKFQSDEVFYQRQLGLENAHKRYVPLVAHAHSDVLESLTEWGLIGVFSIFLPFFFILLNSFYERNHSVNLLTIGCLLFILFCFLDFPTRTPACLATFTVIFALAAKISSLKSISRY